MKNPIPEYGWVATPEGWGPIQDLIEASGDPATGTLIMLMTINLCHSLVQSEIDTAQEPVEV